MSIVVDIDNLRERVRAQRGRYAELAATAGVTQSYLSKFGRGAYESPRILTLQRLSQALERMEQTDGKDNKAEGESAAA